MMELRPNIALMSTNESKLNNTYEKRQTESQSEI